MFFAKFVRATISCDANRRRQRDAGTDILRGVPDRNQA
jgi:hypothetical protein